MRPAVLGGKRAFPEGPPPWPPADPAIAEALQRAYQDGSWGKYHGRFGEALSERLCQYLQVSFAYPVGSGTFAVELALRAAGVRPGDEVILAAYDYPGNFLTVLALGAVPVLVDVRSDNWLLDLEQLPKAVSSQTRAIIATHLHGAMVAMEQLMEWARSRGIFVVEDAAQVTGAWVQGRRAGTWGDAGVWSFGGSKLLTAGRGGVLLTNDALLYQRARLYCQRANNHVCPLSELQAAVLLPQLEQLDQRNELRSARFGQLIRELGPEAGLTPLANSVVCQPAYYKAGFQFDADFFWPLTREGLLWALGAEGAPVSTGFRALHVGRSPRRYRSAGSLSEATRAHQGLVLLHHTALLADPERLSHLAAAIHGIHQHRAQIAELWESAGPEPPALASPES